MTKPASEPQNFSFITYFRYRGLLFRIGQCRHKKTLFYVDCLHEIDYLAKLDELSKAAMDFVRICKHTTPGIKMQQIYEEELAFAIGFRYSEIEADSLGEVFQKIETSMGKIERTSEIFPSHGPIINEATNE